MLPTFSNAELTPSSNIFLPIDNFHEGVVPDSSTGEFAHQLSKSRNPSDSSRDPTKHYITCANTSAALLALANGLHWEVRSYNKSSRKHETVLVEPGPECVRLMQWFSPMLGHDRLPTDIHAVQVTLAQLRGQFPASAMWSASLFKPGDNANTSGPWDARVSSGRHRPSESTLIASYNTFYGCGGGGCDNVRCLQCSDNAGTLEHKDIQCARHMSVTQAQSCGTGVLRGGDAKAAATADPIDDWVLGEGQGDDVEILTTPPQPHDGPGAPGEPTLVKICSFFQHRGNGRSVNGQPPPLTWWLLGYDYVGVGPANDRVPDSITGHPTLRLRGRSRPVVFPVDAIVRQVHMYHCCGADGSFLCGETPGAAGSGRVRIWRHKFRLATPGSSNGYDRYLLNEVHHSINVDTFI